MDILSSAYPNVTFAASKTPKGTTAVWCGIVSVYTHFMVNTLTADSSTVSKDPIGAKTVFEER